MDIEMILQKFAVFSGLAGAELRACLPYCHDAMEELTARRRSALPAAEPLGSAAAALVNRTTLAAAKALCEEYLAAAGEPDGRKFYFGQVTACK